MRVLSVCSGIGAPECAWSPLGWQFVACSEIEAFPSAVLAHHYPGVPNRGDMTKFQEWPDADVDVLVGGTPCQSFSVAGLRGGLADPRGNLALTFLAIADRYRPRWVCWENVPGVLSSSGGRDFGAFLGGLGELGYGWSYRVLDAQYFGVAQRRRRVFVVGYLGDWRAAAAVLFERESLSGHPAPSRETGTGVADSAISRALTSSHTATGRLDPNETTFIPVAHTLRAEGFDASEGGAGRGTPLVPVSYRTSGNWRMGNRRHHGRADDRDGPEPSRRGVHAGDLADTSIVARRGVLHWSRTVRRGLHSLFVQRPRRRRWRHGLDAPGDGA